MGYEVKLIVNRKDYEVNDYVSRHGSIYHLTEWSQLIKTVFNHDAYYFYCVDSDNKICGVLPLVHINSVIFGNYMVSLPYFNYGGAIADNADIELLLINEAIKKAQDINSRFIEFRDIKSRTGWVCRDDKVNMILKLPNSIDKLEKDIGSKLRSQIRRPVREGVIIEQGGIELIDSFYHVFSINMRDLGTPVYSKRFFKEILTTFPQYTRLIILTLNGKPISSAFLIGMAGRLEIPWASTIREYNAFSPNMLLYRESLNFAIERKYEYFDFGRSSINSGTYKFKRQWGAQPVQLYWHYWLSEGANPPKLTPNNPKFKLAIRIWQNLPLGITNLVGPMIVKNLP